MTTASPRSELPKAYNPKDVEEPLYQWWEASGFFKPAGDLAKPPFVIIMPPPNVTGELHLGHAMTASIEDALVRYHRMLGEPTLWLPGADHAGIATQMVVERSLAAEGVSRHELRRETFVERIWEWVHRYGNIIDNQHRRMGASCDWSRKRFTLDPGPSRAVRTTFKRLYDKGLIYRGERMINWCPTCRTALSDLEVDHFDEQGHMYYIRYRFEEGDGYVTVATTRPETLLGDTAVAVHPDDPRYADLKGKRVLLPVLGRPVPIIADEAVAMDFGTGALKITPGHDPNDFETGQRHDLPIVNILNVDGTLNGEAGPYGGYDRYEARKAIVEQLDREGLLEKIEPHLHAVGHCQRSGDVVEPIVSTQWFVRVAPLAEKAIEAVTSGRIRIVPERFVKVYLNWMENIRDWCISRQLWWGHRIPVWYCDACGHLTVEIDDPTTCGACGSTQIRQDEDVLDTWFSSGLWPHSTLGWPDDTEDLRRFYPTSVMETGYDILFFWVARMIMLGIENTGDIPFRTVYLHGLVRDEQGQKMSKTKGNVVDPLKAAAEYGTDAVRFALTTGTTPGNDTRLSPAKLQAARNFANKLWNAGRFVLSTVSPLPNPLPASGRGDQTPLPLVGRGQGEGQHREDRWILSRLDQTTAEVNRLWAEFQLGEAERVIHDFIWSDFCDWYIELAKVRLRNGDDAPRQVLAYVFERSLRLLHPFMPFVTEELWRHLTQSLPTSQGSHTGLPLPKSIMVASYPQAEGVEGDEQAVAEMELVAEIVRAIRNVRAEFKVEPQRQLDAVVAAPDHREALAEEAEAIRQLARVGSLTFATAPAGAAGIDAVTLVVQRATVTLPMAGVVDVRAERVRIDGELRQAEAYVQQLTQRLANPQFTERAPAEVVEREQARLAESQERIERIRELLANLGA